MPQERVFDGALDNMINMGVGCGQLAGAAGSNPDSNVIVGADFLDGVPSGCLH